MTIFEIFLIGIALAMDAFALTIANCTTYKDTLSKSKEWSMPIAFSLFQFIMPVIGFYIGSIFSKYISSVAGYITAGVFFILSAKIVYDNVKDIKRKDDDDTFKKTKNFNVLVLLLQAVLTSIDALAIGVTFSVKLSMSVFIASAIIGGVTFIIVAIALFIGKSLGKLLGKYAQWAGAVILFALAIKNLVQAILS